VADQHLLLCPGKEIALVGEPASKDGINRPEEFALAHIPFNWERKRLFSS
jgi:hypothetical protein